MGAGGVHLPPIATANVCLNPRVCMHHHWLTNTTLLPSVLTQSPVVQGTLKHEDYFALGIIDNIFFFNSQLSWGLSLRKIQLFDNCSATQNQKALFFCALTFAVSITKGLSEETKDQESFCAVHALNLQPLLEMSPALIWAGTNTKPTLIIRPWDNNSCSCAVMTFSAWQISV